MQSVEEALEECGGIATLSTLASADVSSRALTRAVRERRILRVRQGWYALPGAAPEIIAAVRVGGAATGVSAGQHYGLWTLRDDLLHVAVAPNAARLRAPHASRTPLTDAVSQGVCLHWRRPLGTVPVAVAPLIAVLVHAMECQSEERALVMIDSAVNSGCVTLTALRAAVRYLPMRYSAVLDRGDAASQSGTETLVRLRLRALGIRVRTQFFVAGVGHVDLLVGERLVIECDSHEFHDGDVIAERDYDRDLVLVDRDFLVLRLRYSHVMYEWPRVEAIILGVIRRNRHRRPAPRLA